MFSNLLAGVSSFCKKAGHCVGEAVSVPGENICFKVASLQDLDTFPFIYIALGDVHLDIPPMAVFLAMSWNPANTCVFAPFFDWLVCVRLRR